jgi:GAF domain-containing protein
MKPSNAGVTPSKSASGEGAVPAAADLQAQLGLARDQLAATSDILRAIAASPGDAEGSLRKIAETTARLFNAVGVSFRIVEGDQFGLSVGVGQGAEQISSKIYGDPAKRPVVGGRTLPAGVVRDNRQIHLPDLDNLDAEFADWPGPPIARRAGIRTMVGTPLRTKGGVIGALIVYRSVLQPFEPAELELLQSFADQAVIAIENARLFEAEQQRSRELSESLEQQTATAGILEVISNSPTNSQPAFEAIVQSGSRLFPGAAVMISLPDGDLLRVAAIAGADQNSVDAIKAVYPLPLTREYITAAAILGRREIDISDGASAPQDLRVGVDNFLKSGYAAITVMPMLRGDTAIGAMSVARRTPGPLSGKQIALLRTFASQAVIAIENTRLFGELRESLAQQTATAEVLGVISSSPGELAPVFQTMLDNATRLCGAPFGTMLLRDGDVMRLVARVVPAETTAPLFEIGSELVIAEHANHPLVQMLASPEIVYTPDMRQTPAYLQRNPRLVAFVENIGARSVLRVPLVKDGECIGGFVIFRREISPFNDKQTALMQSFAAQAVIAIENARLLTELRESLEQQTATSDVLRVISSSPGDLQPVFQAMLENATRICEASFGGIFAIEDGSLKLIVQRGLPPDFLAYLEREKPRVGPLHPLSRVLKTRRADHVTDYSQDEAYLARDAMAIPGVEIAGIRTLLTVPMLKDGSVVGAMAVFRQEVRPFSDKQIALLTNFAAQAVIAIENTRLLNELRESLQQQTATADVLRVISSSPGDLHPVFEAMLENAVRICGAKFGTIYRRDGDSLHLVASHNAPAALAEARRRSPHRNVKNNALITRMMATKAAAQIEDAATSPGYLDGTDSGAVAAVDLAGARTVLAVPMLKDDDVVGSFTLMRDEVRRFSDKQIELVGNFASQAVIAIENARLLSELRESLAQQTATADVLHVISSSPGDLEPVFDVMLASATRLCEASFGTVWLHQNDGTMRMAALHGSLPEEFRENWRVGRTFKPTPSVPAARAFHTQRPVHVVDLRDEQCYADGDPLAVPSVDIAGIRSIVAVPLIKEGVPLGALTVYRREVRPFTEKQIELVQNFSSQAVIAIDNTRLLNELRESLSQQTATADVLKVISRSTFDLQTVLQTLIESAAHLCEADQGTIAQQKGDLFFRAATYGFSDEFTQYVKNLPVEPERSSATGRALLEERTIHIPDVQADPDYTFAEAKRLGGFRTILAVPMLREGVAIGVLTLTRIDVRPFTDKQIELVTTFADQAAIAIENVRLFEAEQQRTRELATSLEELRAAQDRLVQTEKLASLGQLTAGIAHEIKNPLNFVNNFSAVSSELIDELKEVLEGADLEDKRRAEIGELTDMLRGNLDKVVQHGKRADSIVKNMLLHSRQGSGEHRTVDLNAIVEEGLNLAYHGARAEKSGFNITLEKSFDPAAGVVDLFPQEITRVLLNLISNGFYAAMKRKGQSTDEGYEPTLRAATQDLGDRVEIRIRDNGVGIPPDVKERMFNPFFTTKPAGEGTGLGLSISHDIIVKQHGGSIEVESEPGQFTEFRITLPRAAAAVTKSGVRA